MTKNVITVKPSASIFRVVDLMNRNAIHRVVVVEKRRTSGCGDGLRFNSNQRHLEAFTFS